MPQRTDLKVEIDAESAKFTREMAKAAAATQRLEVAIAKAHIQAQKFDKALDDKAAQKQAKAMQTLGKGMLVFGAATVAGLGLAARAAIGWESAWAGVRKTVDGSAEEMAELEQGLRGLARTLPATHGEIAAVAEAAGQLGVARQDIVAFTRVMVDLGETTNLSADEAATSIAQLMNVMQTAPQDVGRLAATLVELGNNGASTERDIIQMAQRIAGAGRVIGMSEADVLSFANALASVGIEAEAGGSAISRVMVDIGSAVASGGDSVVEFARVAGLSAAEFSDSFRKDPAKAINAFVAGLGRIDESGGNVFATLEALGFSEIRVRDALLRMAGAGDLLGQSLDDGARAWKENTALLEEAAKRYDTAEAKIQVAKNTMMDFAIDVGNVLLPALASLAETGSNVIGFFADLPGPVKVAATVLGTLAGAASLAGGAFLLLAPRLAAARVEMALLATTAPRTAAAVGMLGKAMSGLLAVGATLLVIDQVENAFRDAAPGVEAMTKALLDLNKASNVATLDKLFDTSKLDGFEDAFDRLFNRGLNKKIDDWGTAFVGGTRSANEAKDAFKALDSALANMVSTGNADLAAKSIADLASRFGLTADEVDKLKTLLPGYAEALAGADNKQKLAADSAKKTSGGLSEVEKTAKEAEDAIDALKDALDQLNGGTISYREALIAYEKELDDATEAAVKLTGGVNKQKTAFDITSEAGRAKEEVLLGLATKANDLAKAILDETGSEEQMRASLVRSRDSLVATAVQMGLGKDAAIAYADSVLAIPAAKSTTITTSGLTKSEDELLGYLQTLNRIPDYITTNVKLLTSGKVSPALFEALQGNAGGGYITGPGTSTSDSIPAMLSTGEYVINAAAVENIGRATLDAINTQRFAGGGLVTGASKTTAAPFQVKGGMTINGLVVQAQDPVEMERKLDQRARLAARR